MVFGVIFIDMAAVSEVIGRPLIVAQTPVKEMTSQLQFPRATPSLTLAGKQ